MSSGRIQLLLVMFIISAVTYGIGFKCGSYYGSNKELKKELLQKAKKERLK